MQLAPCPALTEEGAFLTTMLGHIDCQAQTIGENGYLALASPGSSVSLMLGGALTIFIAMIGYRLLIGESFALRDGAVAVVKLGVALLLASSWPAFRTLAYDVTLHAPAELAATIAHSTGLPGAGDDLVTGLQGADSAFAQLMVLGTGRPPDTDLLVAAPQTPGAQQVQTQVLQIQDRPRFDPQRNAELIGNARTLYLAGAIGAFASVRLLAGLMLALGPLFALALLFDSTRGLFEGWVRILVGTTLGALATSVVLGVELALVTPWLSSILSRRYANIATPDVPVELLATTLLFLITLLVALGGAARVGYGFRLAPIIRRSIERWAGGAAVAESTSLVGAADANAERGDQRSRADAVAASIAATQRREEAGGAGPALGPPRAAVASGVMRDGFQPLPVPLGQATRRRAGSRVSAAAGRRDRGV